MSKGKGIRPRHSQETKDKIFELKASGLPEKEIAKEVGVKFNYVRKLLFINSVYVSKEQHDVNRRIARQKTVPSYRPELTNDIVKLYLDGIKKSEIALRLNVDINKVISDVQLHAPRRLNKEQIDALRPRKYTKDQVEAVKTLRLENKLLKEIVTITGVAESSCRTILLESGITMDSKIRGSKRKVTTAAIDDRITEIRKNGVPRKNIANRFKLSLSTVKRVLATNDVQVSAQVMQLNAQKSKYNNLLDRLNISCKGDRYRLIAESRKGQYLGSDDLEVRDIAPWVCAKEHGWSAAIYTVIAGGWCPRCAHNGPSKQQLEIYEYFKLLLPDEPIYLDRKDIVSPKHIDVFCKLLALEFNGLIYHSTYYQEKEDREVFKSATCEAKGIPFLMVFEDEWNNKQELVKAMIRWRLNRFEGIKLHARKLELRLLKNKDVEVFFNRNHLEGNRFCKFAYGLFCNDKLIMAASVSKKDKSLHEIARLATDYDYSVSGGASRLVKAILNHIDTDLISYSNNRLSTGNVYKTLGFEEITETKKPGYFYTDFKTRLSRKKCMKINDPDILAKYPTETAQALGGVFSQLYLGHSKPLYRIEDCGHKKWILRKNR